MPNVCKQSVYKLTNVVYIKKKKSVSTHYIGLMTLMSVARYSQIQSSLCMLYTRLMTWMEFKTAHYVWEYTSCIQVFLLKFLCNVYIVKALNDWNVNINHMKIEKACEYNVNLCRLNYFNFSLSLIILYKLSVHIMSIYLGKYAVFFLVLAIFDFFKCYWFYGHIWIM